MRKLRASIARVASPKNASSHHLPPPASPPSTSCRTSSSLPPTPPSTAASTTVWEEYEARAARRKDRAAREGAGEQIHTATGYLFKQGSLRKNWKRRYFVVDYPMEDDVADLSAGAAAGDGQSKSWRKLGTQRRKEKSIKKTVRRRLLYFSAPKGEFKGEFVLDAASVRVDDEIDRPHAFSLVTDKRVLYLQAGSEDEREKWCIALDRNYRQKLLRSKFADSVKLLASGQWWNRLDKLDKKQDHNSAASMSTRLQKKSSARDGATAGYTNTALYATLTSDRSSLAFFEDPDELPVVIVAFTQILDATLTTMTTSTQPLLTLTFHTDTGTSSWMLTMKTNKARSHESIESVVRHWHIALLDVKNMIEHETDGGRRSAEFDSNAPLSLHLQKKSMSPDSATTSEEQHNGQVLTKSARGRGAKAAQLDHVGPCLSHALSQLFNACKSGAAEEAASPDTATLPQLQAQDFSEKCKISSAHPPSGQTYDFRAYAPVAFQRMRELSGISNASFAASMSQLSGGAVGEGKSGMVFFRSKDSRFITKTLKSSEKDFFYHRGVLESYYKYMQANPETLLCSFYGLFKIRFSPREGWIVVIVMENAFNTTLEVHEKYDLKGSTKNRFVSEEEQAAGCSVLKDLNFTSKISLDESDASTLLRQVERDVAFLGKHNMMDYSLLLGVHKRSQGERVEYSKSGSVAEAQQSSELPATRWRKDDGGIEGRSAVPTQRNETYFISIIDFLQLYDTSKKMENALKGRLLGHEREVSAVSGIKYADRFAHYVKTITECVTGALSEAQKLKIIMEEDEREQADALAKKAAEDDHRLKSALEKAQIAEASMHATILVKLRNGWPITKHPRKGRPAPRYLVCKDGLIGCIEHVNDSRSLRKKGYHISSILDVIQGAKTAVFERTLPDSTVRAAKHDLCLSMKFRDRTIDVECDTPQAASDLLKCLKKIIT